MSESFPRSKPSNKALTIEEFGKMIERKNKELIEEKKRNYSYIDYTEKERQLASDSSKVLEESPNSKFNSILSSNLAETCSPNTSSEASSFSLGNLKAKTKRLRLFERNEVIENPFRNYVFINLEQK